MTPLLIIIGIAVFLFLISSVVATAIFHKAFVRISNNELDKALAKSDAYIRKSLSPEKAERISNGMSWANAQKYEHIYITSFDGLKLHAKLLQNPLSNGKIILLSHGYHSIPEYDFSGAFQLYYNLGYDMLLIDQRSHGESEGRYITFGVRERYDILKWCKYLRERFGAEYKIILGGISMGSTAVLLASALPELPANVVGIIADCGFTSPYDEFVHILKDSMHIPRFPILSIAEIIAKYSAGFTFKECSTIDAVKNTTLPILFIHGKNDTFVLPENTLKNYDACTSRKELILVPGAGHGLSFLVDERLCTEKLVDFLYKL